MESNTVKDQTELSEVTRPILNQEDGASSNFPKIDVDTINKTEIRYKTECEEKVSYHITTSMTIDTVSTESELVISNSEEREVLKKDAKEEVLDKTIENMTIDDQSAESGIIRRNSEEIETLKEDIMEKGPDQTTANTAIENREVECGGATGNCEKSEIPREDIKLRKLVEDAPLTFVDQDDGLMKLLGKACGMGKEKLINEDLEPYRKLKSDNSKAMGRTVSEEGGFDDVKLNAIHLNFKNRVGERLAYEGGANDDTEIENERAKLNENRTHTNLQSKDTNISGDVRGGVTYETETKHEKERHYRKHLESRPENKVSNSNQSNFPSRSHQGQGSHVSNLKVNDDVYDFNHPQRGYMLTIVNDSFVRQTPRDGAQWDLHKMKEIGRKFGFRSMNHNQEMNLTKEQILRWLSIARRTDHSECDCFMFMISTHGLEQKNALKGGQVDHALVCADDQMIFTSTIFDMFNDTNCPTLKGKPKIFYIQACRGEKLDHGGDVFVVDRQTEDKTCGVSNEEWTDRKGRESLDESDTNYGEDSWAYNQTYGAGSVCGGQESSSQYTRVPTHHHNVTRSTAPSSASHIAMSGHPYQSNQFSQASPTGHPQTSGHPSSSRTYNAQVSHYHHQPTFMVPKVSTQPQYQSQLHRTKVLHAPGHLVSRIYAPTPYAIVDTPSLKCDNDMLIMYAIPPGMFAWRNTSEGSWMIDYLHRVLMAYNMKRPRNFLNLMTKVSALMSQRTTNTPSAPDMHAKKAVSVIESKLDKDIIFKQKGPGSDWVKKTKKFAL